MATNSASRMPQRVDSFSEPLFHRSLILETRAPERHLETSVRILRRVRHMLSSQDRKRELDDCPVEEAPPSAPPERPTGAAASRKTVHWVRTGTRATVKCWDRASLQRGLRWR